MLEQIAGEQKADCGLQLPTGDGDALVVVRESAGLVGSALEDVLSKLFMIDLLLMPVSGRTWRSTMKMCRWRKSEASCTCVSCRSSTLKSPWTTSAQLFLTL